MQSAWIKLGLLTAVLAVAAALPSCGGDDDDDDTSGGSGAANAGRPAGGAANAGRGSGVGGAAPQAVTCGAVVCTPLQTSLGPAIPACCFDAPTNQCGLDTALLAGFGVTPDRPCEPLDQPGEPDRTCPNSEPVMLGTTNLPAFQGCCREEAGVCGLLIDAVAVIPIGLGCIDSGPFTDGGAPLPCGAGTGAGGAP